jgi:hypothetical protein
VRCFDAETCDVWTGIERMTLTAAGVVRTYGIVETGTRSRAVDQIRVIAQTMGVKLETSISSIRLLG